MCAAKTAMSGGHASTGAMPSGGCPSADLLMPDRANLPLMGIPKGYVVQLEPTHWLTHKLPPSFDRQKTIDKFIFDLDNYLFLDRTGLISEVSTMSEIEFDRYAVRHVQTHQVERDLTIAKFSRELDHWIENREAEASKYREAVLNVFRTFGKMGHGMARIYAATTAGLPPTTENLALIDDTISFLLDAKELVRDGIKGKGAGLRLPTTAPAAEEEDEPIEDLDQEEEEPEGSPMPPPVVAAPVSARVLAEKVAPPYTALPSHKREHATPRSKKRRR